MADPVGLPDRTGESPGPRLRFRSTAAPHQVLTTIREQLPEERASRIPPELRREGLHRVCVEITEDRFVVRMPALGDADDIRLYGQVRPSGDGGTVVSASCGDPGQRMALQGFGLAGIVALLFDHYSLGGALLFTAGAAALGHAYTEARVRRGDHPTARYLADRLAAVVATTHSGGADAADPG